MPLNLNQNEVITQTIRFVKQTLYNAEGGHDWFHIERVYKNALLIYSKITPTTDQDNIDLFVVSLSALLHDIADSKFHNGDESIGPTMAKAFLKTEDISEKQINHTIKIIENVSFKGGNRAQKFNSKELEIVQDADRLDALGAIGIARTFNYGGFKNRKLYDPEIMPNLKMTPLEYKASEAPTINHFYEKLLLLKDKMNTKIAKQIAEERTNFMKTFLQQFYEEWDGEK